MKRTTIETDLIIPTTITQLEQFSNYMFEKLNGT